MNIGDTIDINRVPDGAKPVGKWPCGWKWVQREEGRRVFYFVIPVGQRGRIGHMIHGYYVVQKRDISKSK